MICMCVYRSPDQDKTETQRVLGMGKNRPLISSTMSESEYWCGGFEMKIKYCTKIITAWHPHYLRWHPLCCQVDVHMIPKPLWGLDTGGQGDKTRQKLSTIQKLTQSIFIVRFRFQLHCLTRPVVNLSDWSILIPCLVRANFYLFPPRQLLLQSVVGTVETHNWRLETIKLGLESLESQIVWSDRSELKTLLQLFPWREKHSEREEESVTNCQILRR